MFHVSDKQVKKKKKSRTQDRVPRGKKLEAEPNGLAVAKVREN